MPRCPAFRPREFARNVLFVKAYGTLERDKCTAQSLLPPLGQLWLRPRFDRASANPEAPRRTSFSARESHGLFYSRSGGTFVAVVARRSPQHLESGAQLSRIRPVPVLAPPV